jgi:hypothetical protein
MAVGIVDGKETGEAAGSQRVRKAGTPMSHAGKKIEQADLKMAKTSASGMSAVWDS